MVESRIALRKLTPAISLALFTVAILVVHHEIGIYHWQDIRRALHDFPLRLTAMCAGATLLSYIALSFYDYLALEYAGEKLPYSRVLFTSFLSYAISNNVGHAWLSGGSMRYRLYTEWGIPGISIAKVVLFCTVSYFLGAVTVMVAGYALSPDHDLITSKLPGLQAYQLSLAAPPPPAGSFDAAAATLADVVNIYDTRRSLGLTDAEKADLVQYLKSL
jgi:uncharacterized membrane protein YbhN (UPF0104 family)